MARTILSYFLLGIAAALAGPLTAHAQSPATFTLDGRLFQSGTNSPLQDDVTFRVQILNGDKSCVLYEEVQSQNTTASQGFFLLQIGSINVNDPKRSSADPRNDMALVFQNSKEIPAAGCASPYHPQPGETRYARIMVTPHSTAITQTMSPDLELNSVPSALVAETLQGATPQDFVRVNTIPELTQNAVEDLVKGDSLLYLRANANGASLPVFSSNPSSPSAGQMWFDSSGVIKFYNGSTVQTLGVSGAGITSLTAGTGLSGGTITTSGTIALASLHGSAGTAVKTNYDIYGRVTGSTPLTAADIPAVEYSTLLNTNGLSPWPVSCGAAQFLRWESTTDVFVCDSVSATQITAGLGYTPVNKAGDTMSGALALPANGLTVGASQLIMTGGKVGIGTTTIAAEADFHVSSSTNLPVMKFGPYGYQGLAGAGYPYFGMTLYHNGTNWVSSHPTVRGTLLRMDVNKIHLSSAPPAANPASVTDHLTVDTANNRVGIGTTNPTAEFQVGANSATSSTFVVDTTASQGSVRITTDGSANYLQSGIDLTAGSAKDLRITPYGTVTPWLTIGAGGIDAPGALAAGSLTVGSATVQKVFTIAFTNTANEKADLILGATYWGSLEVELTSSYNMANASGVLTKSYGLGLHTAGTIHMNDARYTKIQGATANHFAISDVTWDPALSAYKIQIVHRTASLNNVSIRVSGLAAPPLSPNLAILKNITVSAVYTTDTTVFDVPTVNPTFGAGSAATPGTAVSGDPDTGLFSAGANTLSLTAGGTEAIRVNTAASAVNYLSVTPAATGAGPILAADGADANVNLNFRTKGTGNFIFSPGNVGIGTTNPTHQIHAYGSGGLWTSEIIVENTNGAAGARLGAINNAGKGGYFNMYGTTLGVPALAGKAGFGSDTGIVIYADGQSATGGTNDIVLAAGGYNNTTLIAKANGNVGIGTTTPGSKLDVNGSIKVNNTVTTAGNELVLEQTGDASGASRLRLRNRLGSNGAVFENASLDLVDFAFVPSTGATSQNNIRLEHRSPYILNSNNTTGEFQYFATGSGATSPWFATGPSATIVKTGSVGIGTTAPPATLSIQGTEIAGGVFTGTTPGLLRVGGGAYTANDLLALDFGMSDRAGGTAPLARIGAEIAVNGSYLRFGTSNLYTSGVTNTAVTIDPAGKVGIGVPAPTQSLDVDGNALFGGASRTLQIGTPGTNSVLRFLGNYTSDQAFIQAGGGASGNGVLRFTKLNTVASDMDQFQVYSANSSFTGNLTVGGSLLAKGNYISVARKTSSWGMTSGYTKLKTTIPWNFATFMAKLRFDGWFYAGSRVFEIGFYLFDSGTGLKFYSPSLETYGYFLPQKVWLSEENGFVSVIFEGNPWGPYGSVNVSIVGEPFGLNQSWLSGWSFVDEGLPSGAVDQVELTPRNSFKNLRAYENLNVTSDTDLSVNLGNATSTVSGTTAAPLKRSINFNGYAGKQLGYVRADDMSTSVGYSNLMFGVVQSGMTATERMRISGQTGNVGIGTTSPSVKLHLHDTSANPALELSGTTVPDFTGVGFGPNVTTQTTGRVMQGSLANGGLAFLGFTANTNVVPAIAFTGHLGSTSPTTPAISFSGWKHNGTSGRVGLTGNETVLSVLSGTTELVSVLGSGNVGIGTSTPAYKLDVQGGDINASGTVKAAGVTLTSDIRYKRDIEPLDDALGKILQLRGVAYDWRRDEFPQKHFADRRQIGVIAQDVEAQFPELVDTDKDGYKSVNYPALIAPVIEALKALFHRVVGTENRQATQDLRIAELEKRAENAERENAALKERLLRLEKLVEDKAAP